MIYGLDLGKGWNMIKYRRIVMATVALLVFSMLLGVIFTGCSDSPDKEQESREVKPGEYYSFLCADEGYKVLKVLVVEEPVRHVCYYNNFFKERPTEDVIPSLYFGKKVKMFPGLLVSKEGSETMTGRKHFAINLMNWEYWEPQFLTEGEVTSDELEAYEEWKKGDRFVADELRVRPTK
jgi:hypothetical protein